jgi:hypothetical protein
MRSAGAALFRMRQRTWVKHAPGPEVTVSDHFLNDRSKATRRPLAALFLAYLVYSLPVTESNTLSCSIDLKH